MEDLKKTYALAVLHMLLHSFVGKIQMVLQNGKIKMASP